MSIKNNPLLPEYKAELSKVFKEDMVEYVIKTTQSLIKLSTGQLFATGKHRLETEFCFGYSSCGQGPSYDECRQEHDDFRQNAAQRFKEENLKGFDSYIEQLDTDNARQPYLVSQYRDDKNANIVIVSWMSGFDFDYNGVDRERCTPLNDKDKDAIKAVYLADKAAVEKRCDAYVKKYGTSKFRTWTYWMDD